MNISNHVVYILFLPILINHQLFLNEYHLLYLLLQHISAPRSHLEGTKPPKLISSLPLIQGLQMSHVNTFVVVISILRFDGRIHGLRIAKLIHLILHKA